MPLWMQHGLVGLLVAGCLWVVAREGVKALRGKQGCGTCKGCGTEPAGTTDVAKPVAVATGRVAFIPSDALSARAGKRYKD